MRARFFRLLPFAFLIPAFVCLPVAAESASEAVFSSGPLKGALLDPPHQIYYAFPGFSARDGTTSGYRLGGSACYSNEFRGYLFNPEAEVFDDDGRFASTRRAEELTAMDYEALVLELDGSMPLGESLRIGLSSRLYFYYGGFLDPVIEGFHGLFGLANASREFFPRGNSYVDIANTRGVRIELDQGGVLLGDTALYWIWTFYESREIAWGLAGALEFPTGRAGTPAGNGYLDTGAQLLFEYAFNPRVVVHLQQGVVVPGELLVPGTNAAPFPISQSLIGVEWVPYAGWSLLGQSRIHTSAIASDESLNHAIFSGARQFEMPVTSLQFGLRRSIDSWRFQLYLEEDALTHEGPDFVLSLSVEQTFF